MSSGLFKNVIYKMCLEIIYLVYMQKENLALNNQEWLICHKTKPKQKNKKNPKNKYIVGYCDILFSVYKLTVGNGVW